MKKILITEDERNYILSKYNLLTEERIDRKVAKRLAKKFADNFTGIKVQDMTFKNDVLSKIVLNGNGYVWNPTTNKMEYLQGNDFINTLNKRLTDGVLNSNIIFDTLKYNDPYFLTDYVYQILIPKFLKTGDQQILQLIVKNINILLDSEIIGKGGYSRIEKQFQNLQSVIQSREFNTTTSVEKKVRLLSQTARPEDNKLGKFIENNLPPSQLRQFLRLVADYKKTATDIEGEIMGLVNNPIAGIKDSKSIIERLNSLESKKDAAALDLYNKIISDSNTPPEIRETLKSLVESRGLEEIWKIDPGSNSVLKSAFEDVTEFSRSMSKIFGKKTWKDSVKEVMGKLIVYAINGNLVSLRVLNEKIIKSSSFGKGVGLAFTRTLLTSVTTPIMVGVLKTFFDFIKWVANRWGYTFETEFDNNKENIVSFCINLISKELTLKGLDGGINLYVPLLKGPLTKMLLCWAGISNCEENLEGYVDESDIPNTMGGAEVRAYTNDETGLKRWLNDNDIPYSEVGSGENENEYFYKDRGTGPTTGNKYWMQHKDNKFEPL